MSYLVIFEVLQIIQQSPVLLGYTFLCLGNKPFFCFIYASKSFEKLDKNTEKGEFVDQCLACAVPKCWSKSTTISQTTKLVIGIGPVKLFTPAL